MSSFGSYEIKAGDCLWNIVKASYKTTDGKSLSNTQIANTVNNIVKDNSDIITNPNLIFVGDTLKLGEYDGFELQIEIEEDPETEGEEPETEGGEGEGETGLYEEFNEWAGQCVKDATTAEIGSMEQEEQEQALNDINSREFSYNEEGTEESRVAGLNELIDGHIAKYDTDKSGSITLEEYMKGEIADYNSELDDVALNISEDQISAWLNGDTDAIQDENAKDALQVCQNMHEFMDCNHNNTLDRNELIAYYNLIDTLEGEHVKDGKFTFSAVGYWSGLAADTEDPKRADIKADIDAKYKTLYPEEFEQ